MAYIKSIRYTASKVMGQNFMQTINRLCYLQNSLQNSKVTTHLFTDTY